jgi:hypothetical protein
MVGGGGNQQEEFSSIASPPPATDEYEVCGRAVMSALETTVTTDKISSPAVRALDRQLRQQMGGRMEDSYIDRFFFISLYTTIQISKRNSDCKTRLHNLSQFGHSEIFIVTV